MNNLQTDSWLVALQIPKRMIGNWFAFMPLRDLQMCTGEGRKNGGCAFASICKAKDGFLGGVKLVELLVCGMGELALL